MICIFTNRQEARRSSKGNKGRDSVPFLGWFSLRTKTPPPSPPHTEKQSHVFLRSLSLSHFLSPSVSPAHFFLLRENHLLGKPFETTVFSDYKMHCFPPQILEENGGASYTLNVASLAHRQWWWGAVVEQGVFPYCPPLKPRCIVRSSVSYSPKNTVSSVKTKYMSMLWPWNPIPWHR